MKRTESNEPTSHMVRSGSVKRWSVAILISIQHNLPTKVQHGQTLDIVWKTALCCGVASLLLAPPAEARCPRTAAGTFSGLITLDSFNESTGHTDSSTGLVRITLAADGTFSGEFDSKNSLEPSGESGTLAGTYTFSTGNCSGQFMLGRDLYRFRLTDSGRLLNAILFNLADTSQQDVNSFQLFRE